MKAGIGLALIALLGTALLLSQSAARRTSAPGAEELWKRRNLGKAFYENPTTQKESVEEFAKALKLAPNSVRERVNYGLSLLRAGRTPEGVKELLAVQQQDARLPHTWFNLGIVYKKDGETDKAIQQLERMAQLAPNEPITRYNLGVLYKLKGETQQAIDAFALASKLNHNLAAPHFQLYNLYRTAGRPEDGKRELARFQELKKAQEGSATPEDMEWSEFSEIYDPIDPTPADTIPRPTLNFTTQALPGKADAATARLHTLNLGDGKPSLLVASRAGLLLFTDEGKPVTDSGLQTVQDVVAAAPADVDNDGRQDVAVVTPAGVFLHRNVNGKFAAAEKLADGAYRAVVWVDCDHDYDQDALLLGDASKLLRNQGTAGFVDRTADFPFVPGKALDGVVLRVIADSKSFDVAISYEDRSGVVYRDRLGARYEAEPIEALRPAAQQLVAADWDYDSYPDLLYRDANGINLAHNNAGRWSHRAGIASRTGFVAADLNNLGEHTIVAGDVVQALPQDGRTPPPTQPSVRKANAWTAADFNQDGLQDLAAVDPDGSLHLLTNKTVTQGQWLRVEPQGVKNLKLAPGAEVEVRAGTLYQKKLYQGLPLHFGLRGHKTVETVRITWPNGLIQNEINQAAGRAVSYKEAQRLSGSCPMIFTWNGRRFEFITDVLGVAPLGASSGDGQYFPTDHDEYVSIPGTALQPVDGRYRLRVTEELGEVSYLDELQLIAVDHPADVEVFSNEKWKSPPYPEFRLFGVRQRLYPVSARDEQGRDVWSRIVQRDKVYADTFARTMDNVATMHALELDFGNVARDGKAVLVLNGWVDWADGSTFMREAQQGQGGLQPPSLQVKDSQGSWVTAIADLGMPSGKTKTLSVDLSGIWKSPSRAVRIVTNLCVFWDEVFLGEGVDAPATQLTTLPLQHAAVKFHGFSRSTIHPERRQPEHFEYAPTTTVSLWNPTRGLYTRYGDVRPLLTKIDDQLVIMGSGDEVTLEYAALPPPRKGWTRDFLLKVDGWAKDADANTAFGQQVEPLPFHRMSQYPYAAGEQYPDEPALAAWRARYNTRPGLRLLRPLR